MCRAISVLPLVLTVALCQSPDREALPQEWGYRPADGATVPLNPPALSWVPEKGAAGYTVQWANNPEFADPATVPNLRWTVYTHHQPLKPGTWWWRYRIASEEERQSSWSRARQFIIPAEAAVFPKPTMEDLRRRIPTGHPRLFVRAEDLPKWKQWAAGGGKEPYGRLLARADALLRAEPTPEPTVRANPYDAATRQYWWSNRVETIEALQEAEILAFAWLLTGNSKYGEQAKRFTLKLAEWDPDGPTRFSLNCEAAKPLVHRLARAYDWAWPLFTPEERSKIRAVLLRRARDAWNSGEVKQGGGHLAEPYSSHGNRTWHKLAENAIATLGETPESEEFLEYAMAKFFGAYPVWSDDDGGWHEGLNYLGGYMSKTRWWIDIARTAMNIDAFQKPFFTRIGDYAMYSAPPGTPNLGFGDLAIGPVSRGWSFLHYYVRNTGNAHWAWWLQQWDVGETNEEPVLDFLWSAAPRPNPQAPSGVPPSKLFEGTGVAILNSNLLDGRENVQLRFKSSPMGRWSHGLDPQNSFTLNAYGSALLVNNVYRDLYGSPFHSKWVWSTRAQNAVLINGEGQRPRSPAHDGRIVKAEFQPGLDYVSGEAAPAYAQNLKRARRHIVFVKPDVAFIADEIQAAKPGTYQWMLHAPQAFQVDESQQRLVLDRGAAGVIVEYAAPQPLKLRQWTGYDPEPDAEYLASVKRPPIPPQWHVEASADKPTDDVFTVTVLRVFRQGQTPGSQMRVSRDGGTLRIAAGDVEAAFEQRRIVARKGDRRWTIALPE